jgi:hypothetical protein
VVRWKKLIRTRASPEALFLYFVQTQNLALLVLTLTEVMSCLVRSCWSGVANGVIVINSALPEALAIFLAPPMVTRGWTIMASLFLELRNRGRDTADVAEWLDRRLK